MQTGEAGAGRSTVLILALWFGLVTGLTEGVGLTLFQNFGILTWEMRLTAISPRILWVAAAFYAVLFGLLGLVLWAIAGAVPKLPAVRAGVFIFGTLFFLDVLMLTGRLQRTGAVVLAVGLAVVLMRWTASHEERALRFWRRSLLWVAAAGLAALLGVEVGGPLAERSRASHLPAAPPGAPNMLLVVIDTLRADHVSCYGYPLQTTSYIDGIAREGVQFDTAIAASSWTLPSHASLLTGLFPTQHGAQRDPLDASQVLISEVLIDRGYRTGAVSANTQLFTRAQGFGQGFIHFDDSFFSPADAILRTLYGRQLGKWSEKIIRTDDLLGRRRADNVTSEALRWIDRDRSRPFFLVLNYLEPHDPHAPPQPWRSRFSKRRNPGGLVDSERGRINPRLTPEQQQGEIEAYDGSVALADEQIGRLLGALDEQGLRGKTIVVITSDHGEGLGQHGLQGHGTALYWEMVHVPMILRWPGRVPAGVRVAEPVSQVAVAATLLDLAGLQNTIQFPGRSLAATWQNPGAPGSRTQPRSELAKLPYGSNREAPAFHGAMKSLVQDSWHYIWHEKFGGQLYNWKDDPSEVHDLARTPEGERLAARFADQLGVRTKNEATNRGEEAVQNPSK
jgi:arylsulfatase A-like enzyme